VFVSRYSGGAPLASLVGQAWELDELAAAYRSFLAAFATARAADPLARLVELVHAWRAFPWSDPGLPRELLPSGWAGERAAALFARRHSAWSAPAQREWLRVNAG
jgi:phenylacetic acid degradation operon negative regulatory protein